MRKLIIAAILFGSFSGHAVEVGSWIATHDQLMAMSLKRRVEYLKELRTIVTEFEANTQSRLPERTASLFDAFLMPEATAADIGDFAKVNCKANEQATLISGTIYCVLRSSFNGQPGDCGSGYISMGDSPNLDQTSRSFYKQMCFSTAYIGQQKNQGKADPLTPQSAAPEDSSRAPSDAKPKTFQGGEGIDPAVQGGNGPDGKSAITPEQKSALEIESKPAEKSAQEPPATSKDCKAIVPKCDNNREDARKDFFGDLKSKKKCIFGGNISEYRGAQMKKGDCKPIAKVEITSGKTLSCKNGSICNPLIFCADVKKMKPFCAQGMEATKSCDDQAPKGAAGAKCLEDLLGNKDFRAKDSWDKFLKDLKAICTDDPTSAKFHCGECQIMYTRIFALNSKFYGNLCQAGSTAPVERPSSSTSPATAPASPASTTR